MPQEMDIYYYDSSSSAPAGAQYELGWLPVARPPANFHRPFRANKGTFSRAKLWVMTRLYAVA
jgi:hypothetical protein